MNVSVGLKKYWLAGVVVLGVGFALALGFTFVKIYPDAQRIDFDLGANGLVLQLTVSPKCPPMPCLLVAPQPLRTSFVAWRVKRNDNGHGISFRYAKLIELNLE